MRVDEAVSEFLSYVENVKMLSKNTLDAYTNDLEQFKAFVGSNKQMHSITLDELRACVGSLSRKKRAASSINRFIVSVHKLFEYCRKWDYIAQNVSVELKSVKMPKRVPKFMTQREIDSSIQFACSRLKRRFCGNLATRRFWSFCIPRVAA